MTTKGAARAHAIVYLAIQAKKLAPITPDTKCVDCGEPASCYDHRDYNKPLDVEPVCAYCNRHRSAAVPDESSAQMERSQFYLPEQFLKGLDSLVKTTGLSAAEHIRRAIDEYLAKISTKGPKQ